ncbi:MAG: hypothetical protein OEM01_13780, partial [Desulfobulbaceae bacterium]|nr:hypothetical protein [Desulfobulbaceae bacterium]
VIRNGGFRDVVLVVADYHVVRSKLLLLAETLGSGCRVRVVGLPSEWSSSQNYKYWYNEAVKFPGSALEYICYHLTGRLLTEHPRVNDFLEMLKRWLLMEV